MNDGLMFTGCFAMRKGLLQEALSGMDWNEYEYSSSSSSHQPMLTTCLLQIARSSS